MLAPAVVLSDAELNQVRHHAVLAHGLAVQAIRAAGPAVDGYFHWSAQDNLEWNAGFGNRFGIVHVDFNTLERTPKLSAEWFAEAARRNQLV